MSVLQKLPVLANHKSSSDFGNRRNFVVPPLGSSGYDFRKASEGRNFFGTFRFLGFE
jgi:hypothetical protein